MKKCFKKFEKVSKFQKIPKNSENAGKKSKVEFQKVNSDQLFH